MGIHTFLLLIGALLMRFGLAVMNVGSVRSKNVAATFARHVLDLSIATLVMWLASYALVHAGEGGWRDMAQLMPILGGGALIGAMHLGATSERSRLWPMLGVSVAVAAVALPITIWCVFGWLGRLGFRDGGAGFVHLLGGAAAAAGAILVGPRDNKYHRDGSSSIIAGHSLPMMMIGALLAMIGGVMITRSPMVLLAASASALACAAYCQKQFSKIDLPLLAASLVAGTVAASPAAVLTSEWILVLTGALAGMVTAAIITRIDMVMRIDDVTGAITIHGVSAVIGLIAATNFRTDFVERIKSFGVQVLGIVLIAAIGGAVAWGALLLIRRITPLRVRADDEFDGLDLVEHDVTSYPDFQHSTIR